jgi:hypothetical protein
MAFMLGLAACTNAPAPPGDAGRDAAPIPGECIVPAQNCGGGCMGYIDLNDTHGGMVFCATMSCTACVPTVANCCH